MRGDSIRDFYAKTLALLGLGVLAGTGALVDYWPSGVALPAVESALPQAQLARTLSITDFESVAVGVRARSLALRAPRVVPVHATEPVPQLPVLALAETPDVAVIRTALFRQPSHGMIPVAAFAVAAADDAVLGEEIPLFDPEATWSGPAVTLSASAVSRGGDDHDSFITGAVKRTGSSIVRTGRKTGASIWGAFRAVSGAVRRALPN